MEGLIEACKDILHNEPSWHTVLSLYDACGDTRAQKAIDTKIARICQRALDLRLDQTQHNDSKFDKMKHQIVSSIVFSGSGRSSYQEESVSKTLELGYALSLATSTAIAKERTNQNTSRVSKDSDNESSSSRIENGDGNMSNKRPRKSPFASAKEKYEEEGGKFDKFRKPTSNGSVTKPNDDRHASSQSQQSKLPPELAQCDVALVERIEADILSRGQTVTFDDISGLQAAKECVIELICWPMAQPHLFQGLRALPRGILLFGPPGTGKTLIGKAIAHQSGATFFSISASSLMSKWIGEGEKTVKTLFAVAAYRQPAVIFIDEVDSLLCQRSTDENEATRRMKTEFMVQLDGASTNLDARVVIIGATNRPEELDEAVRRRFVKRIYIPLPDNDSRNDLLVTLLSGVEHSLHEQDVKELVNLTNGYSGADMQALCTEAAMGPIRELAQQRRGNLEHVRPADIPTITTRHFESALEVVRPSVSPNDLKRYEDWNTIYGSYKIK